MGGGVQFFPNTELWWTIVNLLFLLVPCAILVTAGRLLSRLVKALERIAEALQKR